MSYELCIDKIRQLMGAAGVNVTVAPSTTASPSPKRSAIVQSPSGMSSFNDDGASLNAKK